MGWTVNGARNVGITACIHNAWPAVYSYILSPISFRLHYTSIRSPLKSYSVKMRTTYLKNKNSMYYCCYYCYYIKEQILILNRNLY